MSLEMDVVHVNTLRVLVHFLFCLFVAVCLLYRYLNPAFDMNLMLSIRLANGFLCVLRFSYASLSRALFYGLAVTLYKYSWGIREPKKKPTA